MNFLKVLNRNLIHFIKGYGSVITLLPKIDDKEEIKKDFIAVGQDFWTIIKKEEIHLDRKQPKST